MRGKAHLACSPLDAVSRSPVSVRWCAWFITHGEKVSGCVFITAGPITKLFGGGVCVYYCRTYYATGTIYNTAGDQTDLFGSLPCLGPSSAIKKNRSDFGFRFVVKWSPTTLTTKQINPFCTARLL